MRDEKIKLPFRRQWAGTNPSGATLEVEDRLYECQSMLAPEHPVDGKFFLDSSLAARVSEWPDNPDLSQCMFVIAVKLRLT